MTINEIQLTVDQLKERHPKLNEGLMSTLLLAGGWDERSIKEAVMLFNRGLNNIALPHEDNISLLELPKLSLPEPTEEDKKIMEEKPKEKESLVASQSDNSSANKIKIKATLPDDLPMKPFESSHHIWSFSRYKDIFYGNEKEEDVEDIEDEVLEKAQKKEESKVEIVKKEDKIIIPEQKTSKVTASPLVKVPITKEDEVIIATIGMLLLIVTILVIYMYLNGRL